MKINWQGQYLLPFPNCHLQSGNDNLPYCWVGENKSFGPATISKSRYTWLVYEPPMSLWVVWCAFTGDCKCLKRCILLPVRLLCPKKSESTFGRKITCPSNSSCPLYQHTSTNYWGCYVWFYCYLWKYWAATVLREETVTWIKNNGYYLRLVS